ncbi:hypothetical protein BKA70DRAFT_1467297 [Coprinopsis sp. MPI-PUGE-AT-0042]|nr:hypothetical protein BKA70DRAFT_1467297 [Coprinopsis sp. MPI-PUGE-AT-0042]
MLSPALADFESPSLPEAGADGLGDIIDHPLSSTSSAMANSLPARSLPLSILSFTSTTRRLAFDVLSLVESLITRRHRPIRHLIAVQSAVGISLPRRCGGLFLMIVTEENERTPLKGAAAGPPVHRDQRSPPPPPYGAASHYPLPLPYHHHGPPQGPSQGSQSSVVFTAFPACCVPLANHLPAPHNLRRRNVRRATIKRFLGAYLTSILILFLFGIIVGGIESASTGRWHHVHRHIRMSLQFNLGRGRIRIEMHARVFIGRPAPFTPLPTHQLSLHTWPARTPLVRLILIIEINGPQLLSSSDLIVSSHLNFLIIPLRILAIFFWNPLRLQRGLDPVLRGRLSHMTQHVSNKDASDEMGWVYATCTPSLSVFKASAVLSVPIIVPPYRHNTTLHNGFLR